MRIYFLSERRAALKLNGAYLGVIDGFERFVDFDDGELAKGVLAEALAEGCAAVTFFIDCKLLKSPPDFLNVYLAEGDAVIYIARFPAADGKLRVIAQGRIEKTCATLFCDGGGYYLSCDGDGGCRLYNLPKGFERGAFKTDKICGNEALLLEGDGCLAIVSAEGRQVFCNPAESYKIENTLKIAVNFATCAACKAECEFAFDGKTMTLIGSVTREYAEVDGRVMHFAFFESVLTRGDFSKYLCDGLAAKARLMYDYLGEFVDVTVPHSRFFQRHGDLRAVGLVYPLSSNLYEIKYFAVDINEGKITNIYAVEGPTR